MKRSQMRRWFPVYDNTVQPIYPEVWAQEGLMRLEANCVAANTVYRNFENEMKSAGEVVNAHIPATFFAKRKGVNSDVTIQNVQYINVPIKLNQHLHTSFLIRDAEATKSQMDLIQDNLIPAVASISQLLDTVVTTQVYKSLLARDGVIGYLGATPGIDFFTQARATLNSRKVPLADRHFLIDPVTEGHLLELSTFHEADKLGDDGTAMREGSLGRKFGFNIWMDQNVPSIDINEDNYIQGEIDESDGYAVGTTTVVTTGWGTEVPEAGAWVCFSPAGSDDGDLTPHWITAYDASSGELTFSPGLRARVEYGAHVIVTIPGAVDLTDGYAVGEDEDISVDGFTNQILQTGQLISVGVPTEADLTYNPFNACRIHGLMQTDENTLLDAPTSMIFDTPLGYAAPNDTIVAPGLPGRYNMAYHKNAIALVTRPLAAPQNGSGAASATASYNGLSLRVTVSYDGRAQGQLVTVDMLCGILVLNADMIVAALA